MQDFARMKSLIAPANSELESTFARLAEHLVSSDRKGQIHFRILCETQAETYGVETGGSAYRVEDPQHASQPDLEVVTRAATWWEIAGGQLSPVEAFLAGRLRVRGDVEWGKAILGELSGGQGICDPCQPRGYRACDPDESEQPTRGESCRS